MTSTTKPIIIYVDDEPRNLSLLELMLGDLYDLKLFDSAVTALKAIKEIEPWVIISDQRMPNMTGLEFLELAAQIMAHVPRIIITGQTSEETIVKLVRHAKLYDYISKPIMEDDLISSIQKAVEYSQSQRDLARLLAEKDALAKSLQEKASTLEKQYNELTDSRRNESAFRKEAEAWASVELIEALLSKKQEFPIRRDLVCVTYDIVNSSAYHDKSIHSVGVRGHILNLFTTALLKYGGIPECHGGDAAFGHFGAFSDQPDAAIRALAVAQELRLGLREIDKMHQITVECGIAIHLAPQAHIQVSEVQVVLQSGQRVKKFLSSASPEIDFLFRIEKLTHNLPGSNIIMSAAIAQKINDDRQKVIALGQPIIGEKQIDCECVMIPSYFATPEILQAFVEKFFKKRNIAA